MMDFNDTMLQMLGAGMRNNSISLGIQYIDVRCYSGPKLSNSEKSFIDGLSLATGYVERSVFHDHFIAGGRTLLASFNSATVVAGGAGDQSEISIPNMSAQAGMAGLVMVSFMTAGNANRVVAAVLYDADTAGLLDLKLNSNLSVTSLLDLGSFTFKLKAAKL